MNFPTITIPDPAAVGQWLDQELSESYHVPAYNAQGWSCLYWNGKTHQHGRGNTPEALLADIRRQFAEADPLAKLRKEADKLGCDIVQRGEGPHPVPGVNCDITGNPIQ
jgi:hypothetical protein